MPSAQLRADMGKFNQELMDAGVFVDAAGLQARIWKVKSLDEAIEWVKRSPNPMLEPSDIEIRQLFEMEDFA